MLTEEDLKTVPGLTPEQMAVITKLSENDNETIIDATTRKHYDTQEADILEVSGIPKEPKEKAYDYNKRVLAALKKDADAGSGIKKDRDTLKGKIADLEKQISEGKGNEAIQAKLAELEKNLRDKEKEVSDWKGRHKTETETFQKQLATEQEKNRAILIDAQFSQALAGVKYKDETVLAKEVREAFIDKAKAGVLASYNPDFIDDGKGGQRLVFRDKVTGDIMKNKDNGLEPFTAGELLTKQIQPVLDPGRKQNGIGLKNGQPAKGQPFALNGHTTQVQADSAIEDYLIAQGVPRGTKEFTEQRTALRKESDVASLPVE